MNMSFEEMKNLIKPRLKEYLISIGIDTTSNFNCLNPAHKDNNPSMAFYSDSNVCYCFSCQARYDIFDIYKIREGLSISEVCNKYRPDINIVNDNSIKVIQKIENIEHLENPDYTNSYTYWHNNINEIHYFQNRGLSEEVINRYNLGYSKKNNAVIIPTSKSSYQKRNIDPNCKKTDRYRKVKGGEIFYCFNESIIGKSENPIFITEGEIDALSIIEAGGEAVAIGGLDNKKHFKSLITQIKPDNIFVLSLDNDPHGREASINLRKELKDLGIKSCICNLSGNYKDCNEALVSNRELFISNVKEAVINPIEYSYRQKSAFYGLNDFITKIEGAKKKACYTTGFDNLDKILDGGFYSGLYVLGAISSLGKTTFTNQLADNIAKSGNDVLIFSLEMDREELIAKSLSRLSFEKSLQKGIGCTQAFTTRNILNGKSIENRENMIHLQQCINDYSNYAKNIFFTIGVGSFGIDKIKESIIDHVNNTGKRPFVIIDYLQIMAAPEGMEKATDKQITDKTVMELKRLSRDMNIPILAISSFNRDSYLSPVDMSSFKESGAIEYSSDVLLGMQYRGMDYSSEDSKDKLRQARIYELRKEQEEIAKKPGQFQQIELKILKNRNGSKGRAYFELCPMFNTFRPEENKQEEYRRL